LKPRIQGIGDYQKLIEEGQAQAHVFSGGFVITEIRDYTLPRERVLNVLLLGGKNLEEWGLRAEARLVEFARVNGCDAIEFACRLGLAAKIKRLGLGYTEERRKLLRKELRCATNTATKDASVTA
jgi:hypothetical protein